MTFTRYLSVVYECIHFKPDILPRCGSPPMGPNWPGSFSHLLRRVLKHMWFHSVDYFAPSWIAAKVHLFPRSPTCLKFNVSVLFSLDYQTLRQTDAAPSHVVLLVLDAQKRPSIACGRRQHDALPGSVRPRPKDAVLSAPGGQAPRRRRGARAGGCA